MLSAFVAALVFALLAYPIQWNLLESGETYDHDSLMRLVEVRDLLAGRGWFDPVLSRLSPPGIAMHWSRLIDGPVAGLMWLAGTVTGPATAESVVRVLWPFAMLAAYFFLQARLAVRVVGREALLPALVIAATSKLALDNFVAGNTDHHSAVIVLILVLANAAIDPGRSRVAMIGAGVSVTLILAIAIEGLPGAFAFAGWMALCWIAQPDRFRAPLKAFFGAVAVSAVVVFALLIPPTRYLAAECDIYSLPYAAVLVTGSAGMILVSRFSDRLSTNVQRAAAAGGVGALVLGVLAVTGPACFGGPYHMLTQEMQDLWLDLIIEARPLHEALQVAPGSVLPLLIAPLTALAATVFALRASPTASRPFWWLFLLLWCAAFATMLLQLRGIIFLSALSVLPCVWLVTRLAPGRSNSAGLMAYGKYTAAWLLSFGMLHGALIEVLNDDPFSISAETSLDPAITDRNCMRPETFAALNRLPRGLVQSLPHLGGPLLLHTRHPVAVATFHRAGPQIVHAIRLFTQDNPLKHLRTNRPEYLAICLGSRESQVYAAHAPDGLIARLAAGAVPDWLDPLPSPAGSALRLYKIVD